MESSNTLGKSVVNGMKKGLMDDLVDVAIDERKTVPAMRSALSVKEEEIKTSD